MANSDKITITPEPDLRERIEVARERMRRESGLPRVPMSGAVVALIRRGLDASEAGKRPAN